VGMEVDEIVGREGHGGPSLPAADGCGQTVGATDTTGQAYR
jgi:hypothetical protein